MPTADTTADARTGTSRDQRPAVRGHRPRPEVVVFDMGGVLVRLGPLPDLLGFDGPADGFWPRWLASPAVRDFERGIIEPDEFARAFVAEFSLAISPSTFLVNFSRFCQGLMPGAVELVDAIPGSVATALLSNTNDLHWRTQPDAETVAGLCDHEFLSYRTGLLKPDRACFEHVTAQLGVDPGAILLLDDNEINVRGARAAGWRAEVSRGVDEAARVLADHAVIGQEGCVRSG